MTEQATKPMESEAEETCCSVTARVDVFEKDDEFVVYADMPGVAPEDVDVRYNNGELILHGRRTSDIAGYHRDFRLGEQIAADRIEAQLTNGVLTLRLPKVEAVKPKRIAVKG